MSACTICSVFAVSLTLLLTLLSLSLSRSPSNFFSSLRLILSSFQLTVLILQSEVNLRPELHFTLFSRSAQPSLCSSLSLPFLSFQLFSLRLFVWNASFVIRVNYQSSAPTFATVCHRFVCLPVCRAACPSVCLSVCRLSVELSVRLPIHLSTALSIRTSR